MFNNFQRSALSQSSDNRPKGARNIGVLNGNKAFQGFVGLKDKVDYYSFRLTGRSSFKLSLSQLQNNVDVALLQGGKVISRSAKNNKKSESINTTLEAGTYYIRVDQKRSNSKYKLTLNAASLSNPNPPSPTSRKLVSLLTSGGSTVSRMGLVDLGTGKLSFLPLGNQEGTVLLDIAAQGNDTFAVANPNNLYRMNPTTGTYTLVGSMGVSVANSTINSLGFTPSGVLYAAGTEGDFYTVDRTTGKAKLITTIAGFSASGDIVYDVASGRFLATSRNGNGTDSLYSIGLAGDAKLIGNIGFRNVLGLVFDNGTLYGFAPQQQIKINPTTGAGTLDKAITSDVAVAAISGAA
jgi:hypothetical protein